MDDKMPTVHNHNHCDHESCKRFRDHMTDDYYVEMVEENDGVPPDTSEASHLSDVANKIMDLAENDDPAVYRFALVFVDDEGHYQVACSKQTHHQTINLLSRAVSILAYQAQMEDVLFEDMPVQIREVLKRRLQQETRTEKPLYGVPEAVSKPFGDDDTPGAAAMEGGYL